MTTPASPDPTTPTPDSTAPADPTTVSPDTSTAVRDLATTLDAPMPVFGSYVKAKVTANANTATPPTISIQISGDTSTTVDGVRYIDSYSPVVGDTVLIGKQGADMFALGQMNDSGTGSANGWQTPSLNANFATGSGAAGTNNNGPIQYRLILDNGELKMQWKGSISLTGTPTAVCTLPVGFRPAFKKSLILARDPGGGSNVVGCDFGTDGTVLLTGTTTFGNVNGGTTGSATATGTAASAGSHLHGIFTSLDGYLSNAGSNLIHSHIGNDGTDGGGGGTASAGAHTHTITESSHSHTFTPTGAVAAPTWVSFSDVEYFLS